MKKNEIGFGAIGILIGIIIIGLIAAVGWLVYDRQKQSNKPTSANTTQTKKQSAEKPSETSEAKTLEYKNDKLGYSFQYPKEWTVDTLESQGSLYAVRILSNDLKQRSLEIGGEEVTDGSLITLYLPSNFTGEIPLQFDGLQKQLLDNGTIKPQTIMLGTHKAVEYAFAYEGPKNTYIRVVLGATKYAQTSFESKDEEATHPNYATYKEILSSIK